jgi:GntR family transcriptional regulator
MSLDPSQDWIEVSGIRQRIAGGPPLALTQICVRVDLMPSRAALEVWPDAIAEFIAQNSGVVAARIEQEISAVRLDKAAAKSLGEHVGDPALRTLRRYIAKSGQAFQASISLHPGDRFSYRMAVER